jgi:hypothetical protein
MSGRKRTSQVQNHDAEVELRPDGWERFKSAVRAAAKSGPKHRTASDAPKDNAKKKQVSAWPKGPNK